MTDSNRFSLRLVTFVDLLVAAAAFALPWLFPEDGDRYTKALLWSISLTMVWLVLTVCALARWRSRAAWMLLGAPLALFVPLALGWAFLACAYGKGCM
jgi:hypothetical protein